MTRWYAAAELAGLPGMPATKSAVIRRAKAQQWTVRTVAKRGGETQEFSLASLPPETQRALSADLPQSDPARLGAVEGAKLQLKTQLDSTARQTRRLDSLKSAAGLPATEQQRIDARLAILRALDVYRTTHQLTQQAAEHEFADAFSHGRIAIDGTVHRIQPAVSARTLQRWRLAIKEHGISALANSFGSHRKGSGKIDRQPEVHDLLIGALVKFPHARASHLIQILQARLGATCELPSERSLARWLARYRREHAQTLCAIANPDAWKNKYMVAFGSASDGIERLNQRWELDSTPADVMLTDGRHSIIGVIDVYARRPVLLVSKTSKATAVGLATRKALLEFGVPEKAKTDNGSDYTSHYFTRVLRSLDVTHELCKPFAGWEKPYIERFFGTYTRDLAELLDGFIGHNVAERRAIESRKSFAERLMTRDEVVEISLSSAELQKFCDDWIEHIYMHRAHEGLGGKTPWQMVAEWDQPVRRIEDARALDILLAEAPDNHGRRTVQKKGIAVDGAFFVAPELEAFVGQQVLVRFDPQDLGRIYVFGGPDLQFVCVAECPARTGIDRQEVAARAREIQKSRVQTERAALKAAAKKLKTDDLVGEIIRDQAIKNGKLKLFPQRGETHTSDGLRAAADALAARDAPRLTTGDVMPAEEFREKRAALETARETPAQPIFDTPFQRAYWLHQQAATRELTAEESEYLADFRRKNPRSHADIVSMLRERAGNNAGA